ncbi:MAG: septal ring lytic transglycosylase RlpA family protein [Deltaproteobacteria bacterium]|nr:septal ring lytic transglycosylase RlpA family protein [Deltaproteobacteria bacterium]MBW1862614.1 septal ring lytic transglycosylase RlpA family protein [Deltaproteobacteria bacterium]
MIIVSGPVLFEIKRDDFIRLVEGKRKLGVKVLMKLFFTYLIVIFCLLACAREKSYVKVVRPPPLKTIVLPETEKGRIPESYVINGERYYPLPDSDGFVQFGKASWYGKKFHGRPTANGELFDMYKISAAHKTLPMDTCVKVTNLSNKKYIIVRINDRGPFVKGRVIDLSYAAGKKIDMIGAGVTDVKVVALGREVGEFKAKSGSKPIVELKDLKKGEFTIQVGAFQDSRNALRLADYLKVVFDYVNITMYVDENRRTLHRLHISKSKTLVEAKLIEKRLEDMGFTGAFIVSL